MAFGGHSNNESFLAKGCGCIFALFGFAAFLGLVYIFVVQPQPIWGSIVGMINGNETYQPTEENKSVEDIQTEINSQIKNVGSNDVYISEEDLTILLRNKFISFRDITAQIEEGKVVIFWKTSASDTPVVAKVVLVVNDQNRLEITQLGTPRFFFPQFSYVAINNMVNSFLSQESIQEDLKPINSENLKIQDVQFQQDKLYLNILVDVSLF